MKTASVLFVSIFLFSYLGKTQPYFKVVTFTPCNSLKESNRSNPDSCFRIVSRQDSVVDISYPLRMPIGWDTIKAFEELLAFRNDTRICSLSIACYSVLRSQIYMEKEKNYSIQLEALFLVNQLVYPKPFLYSSYPALVDKITNKTYTIDGPAIQVAFDFYSSWLAKIKLDRGNMKLNPLEGSNIRWY